jgi:pre-mRNA-processing factor 17
VLIAGPEIFLISSILRLTSGVSRSRAVDDTVLALSAAASRPLDPSLHIIAFNPTAD